MKQNLNILQNPLKGLRSSHIYHQLCLAQETHVYSVQMTLFQWRDFINFIYQEHTLKKNDINVIKVWTYLTSFNFIYLLLSNWEEKRVEKISLRKKLF